MSEVARRAGWHLEAAPSDHTEHEDILEYRWKVDDVATVTLVKSVALTSPYLVVSAPNPGEVIASISSLVPFFTVAEIVDRLVHAESTDEKVTALSLVAATGLRDYREDLYRTLLARLRDPSARVRVAALLAASQLNWKQLRPTVEQASESDADADVRALGSNFLGLTDWSDG
jgi:hypothetical protein